MTAPRLQLLVDGEPVQFPPAVGGKSTAYIATMGVTVTAEVTAEGLAMFLQENGITP